MTELGDGYFTPEFIASARPLRLLGDDEVAVKMVDEPHTDWAVTAAIMGAKGYDDVAALCYAYAEALTAAEFGVMADTNCTCFVVDEKYHYRHYGALEPGSAYEPNPLCVVHFPKEEGTR